MGSRREARRAGRNIRLDRGHQMLESPPEIQEKSCGIVRRQCRKGKDSGRSRVVARAAAKPMATLAKISDRNFAQNHADGRWTALLLAPSECRFHSGAERRYTTSRRKARSWRAPARGRRRIRRAWRADVRGVSDSSTQRGEIGRQRTRGIDFGDRGFYAGDDGCGRARRRRAAPRSRDVGGRAPWLAWAGKPWERISSRRSRYFASFATPTISHGGRSAYRHSESDNACRWDFDRRRIS